MDRLWNWWCHKDDLWKSAQAWLLLIYSCKPSSKAFSYVVLPCWLVHKSLVIQSILLVVFSVSFLLIYEHDNELEISGKRWKKLFSFHLWIISFLPFFSLGMINMVPTTKRVMILLSFLYSICMCNFAIIFCFWIFFRVFFWAFTADCSATFWIFIPFFHRLPNTRDHEDLLNTGSATHVEQLV